MGADHDLSYQIPSSEFEAMLEEAGVARGDTEGIRRKLYAEGFQMARAWAAPQREELRAAGLGIVVYNVQRTTSQRVLIRVVRIIAFGKLQRTL